MTNAVIQKEIHGFKCKSVKHSTQEIRGGFPGDPVVWHSPCKAGGAGSIPGGERSHMSLGQLNP